MRLALVPLLLGLFLLLPAPAAASDEVPVAGPVPSTLKELGDRLSDLAKRIEALKQVALKDPDEARIKLYAAYPPKVLKSTRGRVRAEDLVRFMVDPTKNTNVRKMAQEALLDARFRPDPDLSDSEKRGPQTRRAYFSKKELVPHLDNDDREARKRANEVLSGYYPSARAQHPEVREYKDDVEKTWGPAQRAWSNFLRKQ